MDRFPRLFRLEKEKEVKVLDRIRDPLDWDWIRNPRGRALGELEVLKGVIQSVSLYAGKQDSWRWSCGGFTDFSVHALRKAIEYCCAGGSHQSGLTYPWNHLIPKKICIFAWRALQERLPVRVSLDRRGIDLDSVLCPRCNSEPETVSHCLIGCAASLNIWSKIFAWWKWSGFHLCSIKDLLLHPGHSLFNSNILLAWRGVIWVAAYFIWRARNDLIFKRKKECAEVTFASIQASAFQWCSRRSKKGAVDWLQWCVDPINASRCLV